MKLKDALAGAQLVHPSDGVHAHREPKDESAEHRLRIRRVARILARPRDWYSLSKEERAKYVMLAGYATFAVEEALYEEQVERLMAKPPPLRRVRSPRRNGR